MKPDLIGPIYKSIVRWTTDLIEELNLTGDFPTLAYQDWENRYDETVLPRGTLLGIDGFSFEENQGLWLLRFALALSSHRDENLHNEIELISAINRRTGEGQKIPLREMVAGEEVSELKVAAWQLMPMTQSLLRNYRTIGIEALRTGKYDPNP